MNRIDPPVNHLYQIDSKRGRASLKQVCHSLLLLSVVSSLTMTVMMRMSILTSASAISASCSFDSYIPHFPPPSPSFTILHHLHHRRVEVSAALNISSTIPCISMNSLIRHTNIAKKRGNTPSMTLPSTAITILDT